MDILAELSSYFGGYESFLLLILSILTFILAIMLYKKPDHERAKPMRPRVVGVNVNALHRGNRLPAPIPIQTTPAQAVQREEEEDVEDESYKALANVETQVLAVCGYCGYDLMQGYITQYVYTFEGARKLVICPNCGRQFKPQTMRKPKDKLSYRDKYLEERYKVVEEVRNRRRIIVAEPRKAEQQGDEEVKEDFSSYLQCKMCRYLEARDESYWCPVKGNSANPGDKICDQYIIAVMRNVELSQVM
ncbi:MAG: hypothetical protein QXW42_04220 [Thermofilum sp.]